MNLQTLFQRQTEIVRDNTAVLVKREVKPDGAVLYRKAFKQQGYNIWAERENQFFGLFNFKKAKQVVRPYATFNTEQGSVSEVVTYDAGLTIDEWMQVGMLTAQRKMLDDPFLWGDHLLRLAHACLSALYEIHQLGVIHCDIKPDNICLPYLPKNIQTDLSQDIRIDFANIRLIDFSFSLSKDIPLEQAVLPMDSQHNCASYMAPAFRQALLNDQRTGKPSAVNTLDYRIDLYSLGYLLNALLNRPNILWQHAQAEPTLRRLVNEMQGEISSKHFPHPTWMKQLEQCWGEQNQFGVIEKQGQTQQTTRATPITPLIVTPILKAENATPVREESAAAAKYWKTLSTWTGRI